MLLAPRPWNKPKPALRTGREELHEYEAPQAPRLSTQVGTKRVQNEQEPLIRHGCGVLSASLLGSRFPLP